MNMTVCNEMRKKGIQKQIIRFLAVGIAFFALLLIFVKPVRAATLKTNAKPKFVVADCRYTQGKVTLTWKKVKGAKKYIVYAAKKKNGKYKKFATTKKPTVTKAIEAEKYYKVQAVNGSAKSKMSACVHLFATNGNIYNSRSMTTSISLGGFFIRTGGGVTYYYAATKNLTKKAMVFKEGDTCQFIQLNPETREIKNLGTGTLSSDTVTIEPGKDASFTVKASKQTVESGTVLVIQVPFTAGGQTFTLNIARDPANTWVSALTR